jgi:exopolysaccharide production protein ExoQ
MSKLALWICSFVIALMAMPSNINLLGVVGGELTVTIIPFVLSLGLVLGVLVAVQKLSTLRSILRSTNKYFLFFIALASASALWSAFPLTTVYRLYRLYALVLICLLFCLAGWRSDRFSKAILLAMGFLCLSTVFYAVIDPAGVLEPSEIGGLVFSELVGAWRGIVLHKNTLGSIAATGLIVAASELLVKSGRRRILPWVVMAASIVCLIGARSSTAIFTAAFSVAVMTLIFKAPGVKNRRLIHLATLGLVTFFLIYSLGVLNIIPGLGALIEPIVALSGKDMTFSGRTTIWTIMKEEIFLHPLLGIGYASYWIGPDLPSPAFIFKIRMYIYPSEAHNGYLDVMNELGIVGLVALIAYLFEYLRQAVGLLSFDRAKASLYIALLFAQLIANLSESHWWNLANVQFFIITLATFDIACTLKKKKDQIKASSANVYRAEQGQPFSKRQTGIKGRV